MTMMMMGPGTFTLQDWDEIIGELRKYEGKLYFHSALAGHKVDAIRKCDKASFCVIEQDDVQPKKYTNKFGRLNILKSS